MSEIVLNDPGYICAPEDQPTLRIVDANKQANFELGVSMHVYKWDILNTAVENSWGGPDSREKRDWITSIVIELFTEQKEVDIIVIHETLFNALQDEFDVFVEDDSTVLVAQRIVQCYKDCLNGDFTKVHDMYQKYLAREEYRRANGMSYNKVTINEDPANPNVSDDDDDESDDEDYDEDMMDVSESNSTSNSKKEPIVDDDGFTLVTKGNKRR